MTVGKVYLEGNWYDPVCTRTEQDVERAETLEAKIIEEGWASLTTEEKAEWESELVGALNYWDLNRIEINTKYLFDKLRLLGYGTGTLAHKMNWAMGENPYDPEMERIRSNIEELLGYCDFHGYQTLDALSKETFVTIGHLTFLDLWQPICGLYDYQTLSVLGEETFGTIGHLIFLDLKQLISPPDNMLKPDYLKINRIERILDILKSLIEKMAEGFRRSGTFYSGQDFSF